VEVVRCGRPAKYGEIGKVLITDLYSYAMPFIRYDIGDVAVRCAGHCPCGKASDRIDVLGRAADCLPSPDGDVLPPDTMADAVLRLRGVYASQIEMRAEDDIHIQLVPDGSTPDKGEAIDAVRSLVGARAHVSARLVPAIMPEPSGKFRFVKNLSPTAKRLL
jgi:phenylacetate-CoA ligase